MSEHTEQQPLDESSGAEGTVAAAYSAVLGMLDTWGPDERRARVEGVNGWLSDRGAGFTSTVDGVSTTAPLPVDLVPRVISGTEWRLVAAGVEQRSRALAALLDDLATDGEVLREGVLPGWVIDASPGRRDGPDNGIPGHRLVVTGLDVLRAPDGRWLVLEDNAQVPSGVAYALTARDAAAAVVGELYASHQARPLLDVAQGLLDALRAAAPDGTQTPVVALLSDGPGNSAWFEHQRLAELMGIPVVAPSDLDGGADGVVTIPGQAGGRIGVDVLYRRTDESQLRAARTGSGRSAYDVLADAIAADRVTLANALGSGIVDDKAVYAFVPELIEYYLGEKPLLDDVPTWVCGDPEQLTEVMDRLDELVLKPVDGYGGAGLYFGADADAEEQERMRSELQRAPARWVAQEVVAFSTHPTVVDGQIEPRRVDLRVFAAAGPDGWQALPAPLTRVAMRAGSLVVNSSSGGGTKDTWIVD